MSKLDIDSMLDKQKRELLDNRFNRFKEIFPKNWPADDIQALVNSSAHPSEAERLKNEGCPPDLIVEILK